MSSWADVIAFDNYVNPNSISWADKLANSKGDITLDQLKRSRDMAHLIDSNATLWANVQALMRKRFGKINLLAFSKHCGIGLATVQRIKAQETSVGIAVLDKIAEKFDLAPWQLLVPGLDPVSPPALQPVSPAERALYEKIMSAAKAIVASEPGVTDYLKK